MAASMERRKRTIVPTAIGAGSSSWGVPEGVDSFRQRCLFSLVANAWWDTHDDRLACPKEVAVEVSVAVRLELVAGSTRADAAASLVTATSFQGVELLGIEGGLATDLAERVGLSTTLMICRPGQEADQVQDTAARRCTCTGERLGQVDEELPPFSSTMAVVSLARSVSMNSWR